MRQGLAVMRRELTASFFSPVKMVQPASRDKPKRPTKASQARVRE